jgi:hypothetical protein
MVVPEVVDTGRWEAAVRWDELFGDLEAQFDAAERADRDAEIRDRTRREWASVRLAERLRVHVGQAVTVTVAATVRLTGELVDMGADWLLLEEEAGRRHVVVPTAAIETVAGVSASAGVPGDEGRLAARLTLGYALRALARDRAATTVLLGSGGSVSGTLDRVGADFLEITEHPPGEPRRRGSVRGARLVPFTAVAALRSG